MSGLPPSTNDGHRPPEHYARPAAVDLAAIFVALSLGPRRT